MGATAEHNVAEECVLVGTLEEPIAKWQVYGWWTDINAERTPRVTPSLRKKYPDFKPTLETRVWPDTTEPLEVSFDWLTLDHFGKHLELSQIKQACIDLCEESRKRDYVILGITPKRVEPRPSKYPSRSSSGYKLPPTQNQHELTHELRKVTRRSRSARTSRSPSPVPSEPIKPRRPSTSATSVTSTTSSGTKFTSFTDDMWDKYTDSDFF